MCRVNGIPIEPYAVRVPAMLDVLRIAVVAWLAEGLERALEELDGIAVVPLDVMRDGRHPDPAALLARFAERLAGQLTLAASQPSGGLVEVLPGLAPGSGLHVCPLQVLVRSTRATMVSAMAISSLRLERAQPTDDRLSSTESRFVPVLNGCFAAYTHRKVDILGRRDDHDGPGNAWR
jgi:hypothetical protein